MAHLQSWYITYLALYTHTALSVYMNVRNFSDRLHLPTPTMRKQNPQTCSSFNSLCNMSALVARIMNDCCKFVDVWINQT